MDFKTTLETFAAAQGWRTEYSRPDYQNLLDATAFVADNVSGVGVDESIMFIDPIVTQVNGNGAISYQGTFLVMTRSNHDEKYDDRYSKYIKPLKAILLKTFYNQLRCNFDFNLWRATEVINIKDLNGDGLSISYNVIGYDPETP